MGQLATTNDGQKTDSWTSSPGRARGAGRGTRACVAFQLEHPGPVTIMRSRRRCDAEVLGPEQAIGMREELATSLCVPRELLVALPGNSSRGGEIAVNLDLLGVSSRLDLSQAGTVTTAVIAASASVLVAVLAYILNQHGQIRQEGRQARLARVSSQVRELYGPLNAMVDVNERIWEAFRNSELPPQEERSPDAGTEIWRRWRDGALMPANRRMRDLIVENADLLVETEVPQVLRDFCAHVASAEIVLAAEIEGRSERPLIQHPGAAYVEYIHQTFVALKMEQQQLMQTVASPVTPVRQR